MNNFFMMFFCQLFFGAFLFSPSGKECEQLFSKGSLAKDDLTSFCQCLSLAKEHFGRPGCFHFNNTQNPYCLVHADSKIYASDLVLACDQYLKNLNKGAVDVPAQAVQQDKSYGYGMAAITVGFFAIYKLFRCFCGQRRENVGRN